MTNDYEKHLLEARTYQDGPGQPTNGIVELMVKVDDLRMEKAQLIKALRYLVKEIEEPTSFYANPLEHALDVLDNFKDE